MYYEVRGSGDPVVLLHTLVVGPGQEHVGPFGGIVNAW
jgi:hypothetical protein